MADSAASRVLRLNQSSRDRTRSSSSRQRQTKGRKRSFSTSSGHDKKKKKDRGRSSTPDKTPKKEEKKKKKRRSSTPEPAPAWFRGGSQRIREETETYLAYRRTLNFLGFLFGSRLSFLSPGYWRREEIWKPRLPAPPAVPNPVEQTKDSQAGVSQKVWGTVFGFGIFEVHLRWYWDCATPPTSYSYPCVTASATTPPSPAA